MRTDLLALIAIAALVGGCREEGRKPIAEASPADGPGGKVDGKGNGGPHDGAKPKDGPRPRDGVSPADKPKIPDGTASTVFRFVSWADTKTATTTLSTLADQIFAHKPVLTIYPGDMVDSWSSSAMDAWRKAAGGELTSDPTNGTNPNGIFNITFTVRGNHDNSASGYESWMAANHPLSAAATAIGAKSFSSLSGKANSVFSFDYRNAHFVGLDAPGDMTGLSSAQITWLDGDLTAAEGRGVKHTFIYFHGPIYCCDGHCSCSTGICSTSSVVNSLLSTLNKHASVSATFHGHEHLYSHVYLDSARDSRITHAFHHFVTGSAGAGPSSCNQPGRYDYCMSANGFVTVDVDGAKVTVTFYKQGSTQAQKVISYTKP